MKFSSLFSKLFVITPIIFSFGCSVNPVSGKKDFVLISEQQEIVMGQQAHAEVTQKYKYYNHPILQSYVNAVGQSLASKSHRSHLKYAFTIVDTPKVNAFALPGGYIYVTRGLMAYLNSEAELAGVLGHELGHVTARHGVRQQSIGVVTDIATRVLGSKYGYQNTFSTIGALVTRGYGRDQELEADRLGAEYLAQIGYAPENMIRVVETLKAQEDYSRYTSSGKQGSYHGLFSTHPSNDKRLQQVILAAKRFSSAGKRSANRTGYLQKITGMKFNIDKNRVAKIKTVRVKTGETFAKFAQRSPLTKYAEQQLRLLNGMFPKGEPTVGQLIKIIQ